MAGSSNKDGKSGKNRVRRPRETADTPGLGAALTGCEILMTSLHLEWAMPAVAKNTVTLEAPPALPIGLVQGSLQPSPLNRGHRSIQSSKVTE